MGRQQGEFPGKGLLHAAAAEAGRAEAAGPSGDGGGSGPDAGEEAALAAGGSLPHHSQSACRRLALRQGQESASKCTSFTSPFLDFTDRPDLEFGVIIEVVFPLLCDL